MITNYLYFNNKETKIQVERLAKKFSKKGFKIESESDCIIVTK